MTKLVLED